MLTSWLITLKRKWQQVSGALAVLLMFFIPLTRAVLAGTVAPGNHHHQADNNQDKTGNKTGDKTRDNTAASGKTSGPTTPVNPSPMGSTATSRNATGGGEHHHKPHGK